MPSSFVRDETDIDRYVAALRPATVEVLLRHGGVFKGRITRVDLHDLLMQRGDEATPRLWRAPPIAYRTIVSFLTDPSQSSIRSGVEVGAHSLAILSHREPYTQAMLGPPRWGALSLPVDRMTAVGAALAGQDLGEIVTQRIIRPAPAAMQRLQLLHARTASLAATAPRLLAHPATAHAIEQALIGALADCLARPAGAFTMPPGRQRRLAIVERFRAMDDTMPDQPLHLPEACLALGIAERTLRLCCEETLGMSPKQFLIARRLRRARAALLEASPDDSSVTEIAMANGFWQLGRFAGVYRQTFGETPRETLHRR